MCLQWCHVSAQLIDNDLPCEHCPDAVRFAHAERSCAECCHRRVGTARARYGFVAEDAPRAYCGLTRMPLPAAGWPLALRLPAGQTTGCCHWNAELTPPETVLTLTESNVARGLLRRYRVASVAEMFNESDTAPAYTLRACPPKRSGWGVRTATPAPRAGRVREGGGGVQDQTDANVAVLMPLADLAVPEIYGLPASEWV